ncbi:MAG: hypothetical protein LAP86_33745 [Acidobacteriia bacterium]|nr:hypothetical protein [Terriglobia bacterium]
MAPRTSDQDFLVGSELGHYRIAEKIGAGYPEACQSSFLRVSGRFLIDRVLSSFDLHCDPTLN